LKQFKPHFKPNFATFFTKGKPQPFAPEPANLPAITGEIVIREETSVTKLAALLDLTPFQVVADVMELGLFVSVKDSLSFEVVSKVARKHGFFAIRAAS
jgi:hypothetical protein